MPHCEEEGCTSVVKPSELREEVNTGRILCPDHQDGKTVLEPQDPVDPEGLDYGISYTRSNGLRANVSLGGARLSLEVSPDEITKLLGS